VESPGANDNASGLACLLELAERLAGKPPAAEIWLVGFGAEEVGEIGSGDFVTRWEGPPIDAMFAIDTVGAGSTTMVYSLHGSPNAAVAAALGAGSALGIRVEAGSSEYSDHLPFAMAGTPAAFIMRLPEERRHTAGDGPAAVDGRALAETADLVEAAVRTLAQDAADQSLR
jgi:aminopeptidase YwaD